MRQVFALPDVGEGLTEAEILNWHVSVGDTVEVNQIIVEIETAKAAVELPSPYAGTVVELLAEPGATVQVGTPIVAISDAAEEPATTARAGQPAGGSAPAPEAGEPAHAAERAEGAEPVGAKIGEAGVDGRIATLVGYGPKPGSVTRRPRGSPAQPASAAQAEPPVSEPPVSEPPVSEPPVSEPPVSEPPVSEPPAQDEPRARAVVPLAKPPVRKLAKELGVDLREVTGTGPNGVITREDVQAVAEPAEGTEPIGHAAVTPPGATERRVPIRGVRKATAAAMVASAFSAPHVTEFLTVDVTPMIELRDRLRATPAFRDVRLSPLAFAAKAVCLAVRRTPEVNASWKDGDAGKGAEIVYYEHVALGIAAATPRGLIVPKIRDAHRLSLRELAEALAELTATARAGKTPPGDLVGGTFTITNVGVFGVDTGTPILNPGESAILALGAVKQAPWVVDGQLAVRTVCQLALSFDHRVVDGEQGSRFLADVGALLADPGLAMTY
jgi:2-oxoisovalerate dehydrogenase E2 component (dihydrolipoyl transacylase)